MIKSFDEARKILEAVVGLTQDLRTDEAISDQNRLVLAGGDVLHIAERIGETTQTYLEAIKIYNALTNAVNALNPSFEHLNKPKYLKITDDHSLCHDLEDLTKNIPLLATIKAAKDAEGGRVDVIIDYLLERLY